MAKPRSPTFFKVFLESSSSHLPIPSAFVTKFLKDKIPKTPTLKTKTGGFSWRLKIKEIEGNYFFAYGWNTVVKETQLGFGDFIIFKLVDPSTFKISIYGRNGCEKDLNFRHKSNLQSNCSGKSKNGLDLKNVIKIEEDDCDNNEIDEVKVGSTRPDPCFQKIISDKSHKYILRLPTEFVGESRINDKRSVLVKDHEGRMWHMDVQTDKYRDADCYLSSGWSTFREHNDLSEGDVCLFKFFKREGILTLAQVIKKNDSKNLDDLNLRGEVEMKKKRGRPPRKKVDGGRGGDVKSEKDLSDVEIVRKKKGRPSEDESALHVDVVKKTSVEKTEVVRRKRGRPPLEKPCGGGEVVKRKRGRPRIEKPNGGGGVEVKIENDYEFKPNEVVKRKRGRPRCEKPLANVEIEVEMEKRKRGRPPFRSPVRQTQRVVYF